MAETLQRSCLHKWLLLSIIISILIQVVGIAMLDPIGQYDSKEYLSISGNLFNRKCYAVGGTSFKGFEPFKGEISTRMRQPGYPLYLILFYWLVGQKVIVTQISQVILNICSLYLVFLIAETTFGHNLWGGTLVGLGLYFPLWLNSAFVLSETLFTFVLTLSMYVFLRAIYAQRLGKFALTGALLGGASLIRPIAVFMPLLSVIPLVYHTSLRKALLMWGILCMAFLSMLSPWVLRNWLVLEDFTFLSTDGGYNLWYATVEEGESKWHSSPEFRYAVQDGYYITRDANHRFIALAIKNIKADPLGYFERGLKRVMWVWSYFPGSQIFRGNTMLFGLFTLVQICIIFSAVFGLFAVDRKIASWYLFPARGFSCVLVFTKATSRFILPTTPFILILSGQGFRTWVERLIGISQQVLKGE